MINNKTQTFYEVQNNSGFCNRNFLTLEEAEDCVANYNKQNVGDEYYEYWKDVQSKLVIRKITTTYQEVA